MPAPAVEEPRARPAKLREFRSGWRLRGRRGRECWFSLKTGPSSLVCWSSTDTPPDQPRVRVKNSGGSLYVALCLVNPAKRGAHTPTEVRTPPLGVITVVPAHAPEMENQSCLEALFLRRPEWRCWESGAPAVPRYQQAAPFEISAFTDLAKGASVALGSGSTATPALAY